MTFKTRSKNLNALGSQVGWHRDLRAGAVTPNIREVGANAAAQQKAAVLPTFTGRAKSQSMRIAARGRKEPVTKDSRLVLGNAVKASARSLIVRRKYGCMSR